MKWMPDRKVLSGGIAGVIVWGLSLGLAQVGFVIPPEALPGLVLLVGYGISYAVPASEQDIVKKLNNELVAIAAADPTVPVDPSTRPSATPGAGAQRAP